MSSSSRRQPSHAAGAAAPLARLKSRRSARRDTATSRLVREPCSAAPVAVPVAVQRAAAKPAAAGASATTRGPAAAAAAAVERQGAADLRAALPAPRDARSLRRASASVRLHHVRVERVDVRPGGRHSGRPRLRHGAGRRPDDQRVGRRGQHPRQDRGSERAHRAPQGRRPENLGAHVRPGRPADPRAALPLLPRLPDERDDGAAQNGQRPRGRRGLPAGRLHAERPLDGHERALQRRRADQARHAPGRAAHPRHLPGRQARPLRLPPAGRPDARLPPRVGRYDLRADHRRRRGGGRRGEAARDLRGPEHHAAVGCCRAGGRRHSDELPPAGASRPLAAQRGARHARRGSHRLLPEGR